MFITNNLTVTTTPPIKKVVSGGFCIGCGTCKAQNKNIDISLSPFGEYVANIEKLSVEEQHKVSKVCPFGSEINESTLGKDVFPKLAVDDNVGTFGSLYAGYSVKSRMNGSSGGILSHLLEYMLDSDEIDYAIVVRPQDSDNDRGLEFSFDVISKSEEVASCGTSFYYPVSYSKVLDFIQENPGRYAITGIPCFHKALRLLKRENPVFNERIKYQLGLVCGQMKSNLYFEYLLRKSGAKGQISDANFRRKNIEGQANEYYFEAITKKDKQSFKVGNRSIGVNWGMGLFKPKACDYCDDVFAETADIAVMDGWLPQYVKDGRGTSLVVVRDKNIEDMILKSIDNKTLEMETISIEDVVESQLGGLRHRRDGLKYRLKLANGWVPKKRVEASNEHPKLFKTEQLLRLILRKMSRRSMALQVRFGSGLGIYNFFMATPIFCNRLLGKAKRLLK